MKIIDERWLYQNNDDLTIKYLCQINKSDDVTESIVMDTLRPFLDKKKSYLYDQLSESVTEYPGGIRRYAVAYTIKGIEEPGYCYRCGRKAKMFKTALVCPLCLTLIGGF